MSRAATIFLFLLAAGLVVFVATTERWRFSLERTIQPGSALFDFDPADIRFIQIKNGDQSFRIQPGEDGWILDAATRDSASPEAVAAIFRAALETPVLDRIDALLPVLYFGRAIVAYQGRFSPEIAFTLMQRYGVTHSFLFPTALKAMMKAEPQPRRRWSLRLRAIMSAG